MVFLGIKTPSFVCFFLFFWFFLFLLLLSLQPDNCSLSFSQALEVFNIISHVLDCEREDHHPHPDDGDDDVMVMMTMMWMHPNPGIAYR